MNHSLTVKCSDVHSSLGATPGAPPKAAEVLGRVAKCDRQPSPAIYTLFTALIVLEMLDQLFIVGPSPDNSPRLTCLSRNYNTAAQRIISWSLLPNETTPTAVTCMSL